MTEISRELAALGDALRDDIAAVAESQLDLMVREVPEYFEGLDPSLWEFARSATIGFVNAVADAVGNAQPHLDAPASTIDEAVAAARSDVSWSKFLRCYRVGLVGLWEYLFERISAQPKSPSDTQRTVLVVSRLLFGYFDCISTQLEEIYNTERERVLRRGQRRRVALVLQLLDGAPIQEEDLGHRLTGDHIALVVWGRDPETVLIQLREQLACPLLAIPGSGSSVWAWIGGGWPLNAETVRRLRKFEPTDGVSIAVGGLARERDGFVQSHREAMLAYRVAVIAHRAVTHYDDVALEALVIRDEEEARAFADRELGPLTGDDAKSATLRQTLRAYFATGHNGAAAAAFLGVHERTVSYRIANIEERLGRNPASRRDELSVALRIRSLLRSEG